MYVHVFIDAAVVAACNVNIRRHRVGEVVQTSEMTINYSKLY